MHVSLAFVIYLYIALFHAMMFFQSELLTGADLCINIAFAVPSSQEISCMTRLRQYPYCFLAHEVTMALNFIKNSCWVYRSSICGAVHIGVLLDKS